MRLRELTLAIVDRRRSPGALIAESLELGKLLEDCAEFRIDPGEDIASGESLTREGLAISPAQAAMCVREPVRTAAFIRGAAQAIEDNTDSPDRPLRVLYAGCGPYAPLAIPLMSLYPPERVRFTLLDIHRQSLESARALVSRFGFGAHVAGFRHEDACGYTIPEHEAPDVIISETMNAGLAKEPLVAISCRLLAQAPNAVMLPERVCIDVCLMDESNEFTLLSPDHVGEIPEPQRDRVMLGRVFELNAGHARTWEKQAGDLLPAGRVRIPSPLEERYRPKLLTRVQVYPGTVLGDYDSSITCPQPLPGGELLRGGEILQFHYRLGREPGLVHEIVMANPSQKAGKTG